MSIYTKTGDDGTTALYGGKRVTKYDVQIEAYGSVDELTSFIGLVIAKLDNKRHADQLTIIQKDLYHIMSVLSGGKDVLNEVQKHVELIEKTIDTLDKKLPKLTRFILPQGTKESALLHVTRTVCRRAERRIVDFFNNLSAGRQDKTLSHYNNRIIVQYLNRLSDLLFTLARYYNRGQEIST